MKVTATADFLPVATELGGLAARYAERGEVGPPANAADNAWTELTAGGWLGMGLETPGGPGLLELAEVARAWGAHLVPVPFITTMLGCRWRRSAELAAEGQAMTCAISTPAGPLAPFGGWPGIDILGGPRLIELPTAPPKARSSPCLRKSLKASTRHMPRRSSIFARCSSTRTNSFIRTDAPIAKDLI